MAKKAAGIGDNSDKQLVAFIERVERVSEEIKALNEDRKEIFAEVKGIGYDPKIMKLALKIRAMDQAKRAEEEEMLAVYLRALGIE